MNLNSAFHAKLSLNRSFRFVDRLRRNLLLALIALTITLATTVGAPQAVWARPLQADQLYGSLPNASSEHTFTLQPTVKGSQVTLTFSFDPKDNPTIVSQVNFWVVSAEGMRQHREVGRPYYQVAVAAGNPVAGDDYTKRATINVADTQSYTVIVYSDAAVPVNYVLSVDGATLTDLYGQTSAVVAGPSIPRSVEEIAVVDSATATTTSKPKKSSEPKPTTKIADAVIAANGKRYLTIDPSKNDVNVNVTLTFEANDIQAVNGKINFFLFDANGLAELSRGGRPEAVNIAAGNVVVDTPGQLKARLRAVGTQPFTLLLVNQSGQEVLYTLTVSGGKFRPD